MKKIQRAVYLANVIKCSNQNRIDRPENGWILNDRNELEIIFFDGNPFPDAVSNISINIPRDNNAEDDESDPEEGDNVYFGSSDESEDET